MRGNGEFGHDSMSRIPITSHKGLTPIRPIININNRRARNESSVKCSGSFHLLHEAAVTFHICTKDGSEPAFNFLGWARKIGPSVYLLCEGMRHGDPRRTDP